MFRSGLSSGFGVFVDRTKTTSGQRFFLQLGEALGPVSRPLDERPGTVLFNISAPWREIVRAKVRGQRIVLRVDGLYSDRLSEPFLDRFSAPVAALLRIGMKWRRLHDPLADLANFIGQNYTGFLRIALADWVVYQSRFSREVHQRYFSAKPSSIIVNGSIPRPTSSVRARAAANAIHLVTIYDDWKPAKRIYDVARFAAWLVEDKGLPVRLTVLGYTGKVPLSAPRDMRDLLEKRDYVRTLSRFSAFDGAAGQALDEADCYVCFSFRDPCPNAVIESMAHGLPVLGIASGGLPDIVGDAGRLLPADDFGGGYFSPHRFEHDFPLIDFEAARVALLDIVARREEYRERVRLRFERDLGIPVVAGRYAKVLRYVAEEARCD